MISDQAPILGLGVVAVVSLVGNLAQAFYAAHLEELVERPAGFRAIATPPTVNAGSADAKQVADAVQGPGSNGRRRAF